MTSAADDPNGNFKDMSASTSALVDILEARYSLRMLLAERTLTQMRFAICDAIETERERCALLVEYADVPDKETLLRLIRS